MQPRKKGLTRSIVALKVIMFYMVTAFLSHGTNCITGESGEGGNGAEEGEVGFFGEVFSDATGTTNNGISSS